MFPDLVREDVFRLETRRLWLRWPEAGDAGSDAPANLPEASSGDPYRVGGPTWVTSRREENQAGVALHLVLTGRGPDRDAAGVVSLTSIRGRIENCGLKLEGRLAPERRGQGLMTEAVQAVVDAAFMLTDAPLVAASAKVRDPAFRRVLEKCGFAYCGHGLDGAVSGAGLVACDRFRLDRKAWASLKVWRVPGVVQRRAAASPDHRCTGI